MKNKKYYILADIQFTSENRNTPVKGEFYRPIGFFGENCTKSAIIKLNNNESIEMNSFHKNRRIDFISFGSCIEKCMKEYQGKFILGEGSKIVGRGMIKKIIEYID